MTNKARESRARRKLAKDYYVLFKSRKKKNTDPDDLGGYRIVDCENCIERGRNFDLSLDDVEDFVKEMDIIST